jgi:N6-adenosine-specific RNA methylase IME4
MATDEIVALPVGELAEPDAILWLWTTNAFMRDAFRCLDAWGFAQKTILTWCKDRMGTGDWLRGKTEHCLLAVRGKPLVTLTNQTTELRAPLREHSRKPDEFYALVDALCPGTKLDMFARETRAGWALWGAETGKFDAS